MNSIKSAADMARQVKVSSVLNSLLWTLPLQIVGLIIVSFANNLSVEHFFMWTVGLSLFVIFISFLGILIFGDANLLRSENHVFRMKALEMLGDESHEFQDFKELVATNNPDMPDPAESAPPEVKRIQKGDQNA